MKVSSKRNRPPRIAAILALTVASLIALRWALAADPPAKQRDRSPSEKARRELILKSELWRNTLAGLDQWLSIQTMYDKNQIEDIKKQVSGRVEKMSADELEDFRQQLDAKLTMVLSPEGRDILGWVAENLARAAPAYRKKLGIEYPDVARLTAAQLREQLDLLIQKRSDAQANSAAFDRARRARIAGLQAEQKQEFQERQRALDRGAASVPSSYHPGPVRQYPDVVSRPQFGWGFGFW
ncbi:MAG: hypothetical protein ACREHD_18815 [Pirellulales bacterium]